LFLAWYSPLQTIADKHVDAGLSRALVSFGSARILNGLISVVQGTELSMQPLGVGLTLTLGQVLDPINDLVEQFSTLMLYASVAFGIQKALIAFGANWVISLLVSMVVIAWAILAYRKQAPNWLTKVLVVLLMMRFAIPLVTVGSDIVFEQLLAQDYKQSQEALGLASKKIGEVAPPSPQNDADKGWWEKMKDKLANMVPGYAANYDSVVQQLKNLPEQIIKLIVVFVLQTMIVPIFLLWALYVATTAILFPRQNEVTTRNDASAST
jgi:hypothetical protein